MKNIFIILMLTLATGVFAQKPYFQQKVDYKIEVSLDDYNNQLKGQLQLTYHNQSPDELTYIYFHLWPNAYSKRNTDFAQQLIEFDSLRFYFAPDEDLGSISGLDFQIDGQKATFKLDKKHPDFGKLTLNTPLKPGAKITITTPFTVVIPQSFSRLGRVGQSYQITQWYPKPAVYDNEGWHPMPYLSLGEFYSEFGNFDVSITLPENYIVAATGTLKTTSEQLFIQKKIDETTAYFDTLSQATRGIIKEDFPATIQTKKTIRYTAENVHDFAWFADKRFKIQEKKITLPSGKEVICRAFFNKSNEKQWKKSTDYIARAVRFYAANVGEYPYPHATAVQSVYSDGGGMEYPMITLIGQAFSGRGLDNVITHEVGHNWFYGILGSNERDHAWMDEGINSYYEGRYMNKYYKKGDNSLLPNFFSNNSPYGFDELTYLFKVRRNRQQPIDMPSGEMSPINYFGNAYNRPSAFLNLLASYAGQKAFDNAMKTYFSKWKFKHPQPKDLQKVLENQLHKKLNWLFDDAFRTRKTVDYAFSGISDKGNKIQLKIKNKGGVPSPFSITGFKKNKGQIDTISYEWQEGFTGKETILLPNDHLDVYRINAGQITPEFNYNNNHIKTKGLFKKLEPLHLKLLAGLENDRTTTLFLSPVLAWNKYDGGMLGLSLSNMPLLINRPFEFRLSPLYGFGSKRLAGVGMIQYHLLPRKGIFNEITIGAEAKKFHFNHNTIYDYRLAYSKITPFVELILKSDLKHRRVHRIRLQNVILQSERAVFESGGIYNGKEQYTQFFPQISYDYKNTRALHPSALSLTLEYGQDTTFFLPQKSIKASLTIDKAYTYAPKKAIDFRFFIGGFLSNTQGDIGTRYPNAFSLADQGVGDYLYDDYFFGRNETEGIWAQQIGARQGGMRYSVGQNHPYGWSNKFIATMSITADLPQDLPLHLPLRPFFDIGYYATKDKPLKWQDNVLWVAGLELELIPNILEVYLPIIESKRIKNNYIERGNYLSRISFLINFNKVNPWKEIENYLPW